MERKSGRKSTNTNAGKDRISSLPDVIIGHILSFLPTKYTVETSILSKRWRYVWTNITSLLFYNTPEYTRFHNFVDRVLHQCTSKNIQRFCLHTKHDGSYKVTTWINEAIRRNVYELELCLSKIPSCVFTCKTPTVLKLDVVNLSQNEIPTSFYLPSLRILFIIANHLSINLMEKFFRNCSALEDLNVRVHFVEDNSDFIISSPVLKRFKFESYSVCIESCKFVINAPNLECMEMYDGNLQGRSVQSSSLVNEAKAGVPEVLRSFHGETIANRAVELLGGSSGVKSLSLSQYILRGLDHAYQDHLPIFYNMTRLELSKFEPGGQKILPRLLEVSPKLKVLILNKGCSDMSASSASYWTEPQILPECLSSCLEDVEIKGFQFWDGYETKMVEYLLQHAAVLKNLTINGEAVLDPEIKVEVCQRLLSVTKELKKLSDSSLW